jgi:hypothetical protein
MQLWQDGPEIDEGENAPGRSLMKDSYALVGRDGSDASPCVVAGC